MGFKVASRAARVERRGVSRSLRRRGAVPLGMPSRLRWPHGFVCPACGHRGHCVLAGRSLYQCYRCKKQTSSFGGHDLPRHQAAADAVVRGRPPDRNGEERDFLGRAGAPSRGQAADRLDREAQDHGGRWRGARQTRRCRGGWRWTMLTSAARAPAASGAVARRARRPSWRRSPPAPRAGRARSSGSRSRASASARSRAAPSAGWPPEARSSPTACAAGTRSTGSSEAIARSAPAPGGRPPAWRPSWVNTTLGNIKSAIPSERPARPRLPNALPRRSSTTGPAQHA